MPPRVPTEADFAPLQSSLPHKLHFPDPPESTVAILIVLHGLGDSDAGFSAFAKTLSLPGVLAITVRGTATLPASIVGDEPPPAGGGYFHWGDDVTLDQATGEFDEDPGFTRAEDLVVGKLVRDTLLQQCGWELSDIMMFGFGQGGSLALGLASKMRLGPRVEDTATGGGEGGEEGKAFKGVISIGGPLPASMVPSTYTGGKSRTKVLVCQLDDEAVEAVQREFADVAVVKWQRRDMDMPRSREEMLPIMKFFAERLNTGI